MKNTAESALSRREFLLGMLSRSPSPLPIYPQPAGQGTTDMQIADSCTLCNACVDSCVHEALRIEEGELFFVSGKCTGCGDCRQICPEQSITLLEKEKEMELAEKSVYKDVMVRCSKCNTPYASAKMVRKISATLGFGEMMPKCPNCKGLDMYEALFAK